MTAKELIEEVLEASKDGEREMVCGECGEWIRVRSVEAKLARMLKTVLGYRIGLGDTIHDQVLDELDQIAGVRNDFTERRPAPFYARYCPPLTVSNKYKDWQQALTLDSAVC